MRIALLTGTAAALALMAATAARAETIYVTDPDAVAAPGTVYATEPDTIVQDRFYMPDRPAVVVAPRRERMIVVPRREVVIDQPEYVVPRESFTYRGTVRTGGYYTTGYSSGGSCMIDRNGFERCF